MTAAPSRLGHGRLRRILALVRKESWQVVRDPSSIAVGIVMPMVLLVLFGYGLSFDLKNLPVALVMEESSAEARGAVSGFELSDYFQTHPVKTMAEAERLLLDKTVNGIVRIPPHFARDVQTARRKSRSSSMAATPIRRASRSAMRKARSARGWRARRRKAMILNRRCIDRSADAALVQRGQ